MYREIDLLREIAKLSDLYLTTGNPRHRIELSDMLKEYENLILSKIYGKTETTEEEQEKK